MTAAIADAGRQMGTPIDARLVPLQEQVRRPEAPFRGVGGLLIVCVNLGNLMFVRANARDAAICRVPGADAGQATRVRAQSVRWRTTGL
jgi:hypothetical protein